MIRTTNYSPVNDIPSWFWKSRILHNLPLNPKMRRRICLEIFDLEHHTFCMNKEFHIEFKKECICMSCLQPMFAYHKYDCKPKVPRLLIKPLRLDDLSTTKAPTPAKETQIKKPEKSEHKNKPDETKHTLNFLENRRKSKRTVKLNTKFTGDDWME